jgi:hypothetical protein
MRSWHDNTAWQDYLWRARTSGERPSIGDVLRAALSEDTPCVGPTYVIEELPLVPLHFHEAMRVTDAEFHDHGCRGWIVTSPRTYYDVRGFGRDVLDVETCAPRPLTGATLWGHPILTTRDVEPGVAWIVGRRRDGSWARLRMEMMTKNKNRQMGTTRWGWHQDGEEIVGQVTCSSMRDWLRTLVSLEGPYERCDDPRERLLGMRKVEGGTRIMLPLVKATDRTTWGIDLPSKFVDDYLRTPEARCRLARDLSTGALSTGDLESMEGATRARMEDEKKRKVLLRSSAGAVAKSLSIVMQARWERGPHLGRAGTTDEHREWALASLQEIRVLLPEHEDRAREIYGLLEWPEDYRRVTGVERFGPAPKFEKIVGMACATCGGTGVTGFISAVRCPDC